MRIVGGEQKGVKLDAPRGLVARPMRDQVRAALFNILGDDRVRGAKVLDLFSGTGALGLEALSRGAAAAVLVEVAAPCLDVIRKNVARLGFGERAIVRRADLSRGLSGLGVDVAPFDLVFMDPPFELLRRAPEPGEACVRSLLRELAQTELLAHDGLIALETPSRAFRIEAELPRLGLELVSRREYGSTALVFLLRVPS